ncbi:MAG: hypothetical protein AAB482_04020 [Patescibacteria group bacterium]
MKTKTKIKKTAHKILVRKSTKVYNFWDDLLKLAVKTGDKNLARDIDKIVYGK